MQRWAVLGAGALGLTVALRLAERGDEVIIYERESEPGGLAAGFPLGAAHLEKFYHHLFRTDHSAVGLIDELGLGDRLEWHRPVTAVFREGRAWPMDSARSVLQFGPLSPLERARLSAGLAYLKLSPSSPDNAETASEWIRRWMGNEAYRTLWEPLLRSKFGEHHDSIAMPWFWARVHLRTSRLGYLRGGFQQLYDSLAHRIAGLGSTVMLDTTVEEVRPEAGKLQVRTNRGNDRFDAVVSTLPGPLTLRLVPSLPEVYKERYATVDGLAAMCLVLALDRRLTDIYWLNLNDDGFPFQPLVEHTNLVGTGDYDGRHIVYLGNYLPVASELLRASPAQLLAAFEPHLKRINPSFRTSWVMETWLFRAPFAQPIVTPGYGRRRAPHLTPVTGLYVANMFQIFPQDRGQNYSIRLADHLVQSVL